MADGPGDDDTKGDRIMQALKHMMDQVVWVYGDYYRVDADALIQAMEEKRLTIAQRQTFSAYELEECIDKSMQTFTQRLFEQVTNLEVDMSYAEEKDSYGRGTIRFFYSLLLRCFQEVEAEMAMFEHCRKVEEQKKRKEAEAKKRKGKKGTEDSTALAPLPEPKPTQAQPTAGRTRLEFSTLNYYGAPPECRTMLWFSMIFVLGGPVLAGKVWDTYQDRKDADRKTVKLKPKSKLKFF